MNPRLREVLRLLAVCVPILSSMGACTGEAVRPPKAATAPANGFGDDIAWRSLTEGLRMARDESRPMMLVVHASWCGSCKALKPTFERSEIEDLSRRFVMVNVDQDHEPRSKAFAVDGTYVPRVVFIDPATGKPEPALRNPSRDQYRYFYTPQDDLAAVMREAIERYDRS